MKKWEGWEMLALYIFFAAALIAVACFSYFSRSDDRSALVQCEVKAKLDGDSCAEQHEVCRGQLQAERAACAAVEKANKLVCGGN